MNWKQKLKLYFWGIAVVSLVPPLLALWLVALGHSITVFLVMCAISAGLVLLAGLVVYLNRNNESRIPKQVWQVEGHQVTIPK